MVCTLKCIALYQFEAHEVTAGLHVHIHVKISLIASLQPLLFRESLLSYVVAQTNRTDEVDLLETS